MKERRRLRSVRAVIAMAAMAACSPATPDTIDFGGEKLTRATEWSRGGISSAVYVPAGQTLPAAALQVGALISTEHTTGAALHAWVDGQSLRSGDFRAHSSGAPEESCTAGFSTHGSERRFYLSLKLCKSGVARAACVEADEALEQGRFEQCLHGRECFEDLCDARWLARGEDLERLLANVLAKR